MEILIYIHGNALADENICVPSNRDGLYISYSSLFDFYNTGSYYVEGCRIGGFDYYLKCGPYTLSKDKRDLIVWEILGRVSHLLGDMGVPAHTHNDTHPGVDPDSYEDWMVSNNLIPYNQFEAYDVGGVIDVRLKNDPLRYLFYTTNQVANFFNSNDDSGNSNYSAYYSSDIYSELQSIMTEMNAVVPTQPPHVVFKELIAHYAYLTSMRAIAGLFLWFAQETNQLTTVTNAGTLLTDEIWGNVVLNGNVFVPAGKTLTLCNGTLDLNGFYLKSTGGLILEDGCVIEGEDARVEDNNNIKGIYPSISSAINSSLSGSTIRFAPKTFDLNLLITRYNRKFKGSNVGQTIFNGNVTITNSNYTTFSNVKMHDYHNITVNGGIGTDVYDIDYMNSSTAVSFYNGNNNDLGGINVNSSSTSPACYFYNTSSYVREISIEGFDFGVWATTNSDLTVSYNSYFCNNLLDLYAPSGGQIYVTSSTLSAPWPQSVSGNVTGGTTYECSSSQLSKKIILEEIANEYIPSDELIKLNKDYLLLLTSISDENEDKSPTVLLGYKPEFDAIIKDYKALLTVNSSPIETTAIVSKIEKCYYATERQDEFEAYINTLLREKSSPYIERYFVNLNLNKGKYKEAIDICEKILSSKGINEPLTCEMLYEEALIYKYSLSNTAKANELFAKLAKDYPNNGLFSFAARELEQEGLEIPKAEDGSINHGEVIAKGFTVESYPNPFNPSTTISYSLPSESNVKITIYDIMGRIVKTLASEGKPMGSYQAIWDGTNSNGVKVSSGIYVYRFEAVSLENNKHFTKSAKLMLVK